MMECIESSKLIFREVSEEKGIRLEIDTHYDAQNFVFSVVKGKEMHRLDFQPSLGGGFTITKYIDSFPFFPRLFEFIHNTVPLFPYIAKINYEKIGKIDSGVKDEELKKCILKYVADYL